MIATKLRNYMDRNGLRYDVMAHRHSRNSMETAEFAHIPGRSLAKSVLLEDDQGFLMAVLPATHHVPLGQLSRELSRHLRLATEDELQSVFDDCETGAIPPAGELYGVRMVLDDSLTDSPEIYFEAGDHEHVIQMSRDDFLAMTASAGHMRFPDGNWHH